MHLSDVGAVAGGGLHGGYTIVKAAVREQTQRQQEVFVPLTHPSGEAQVDFGEALVKMNGVLRKVAFFGMALPHSDAAFVMALERETPPDQGAEVDA